MTTWVQLLRRRVERARVMRSDDLEGLMDAADYPTWEPPADWTPDAVVVRDDDQ